MSEELRAAHPALFSTLIGLEGVDTVTSASGDLQVVHDDTIHHRVALQSESYATARAAEGLEKPLPTLPGDEREQLSTWLKAIPGGALVPELMQDGFDAIGLQHEIALGRLVQTFLDVEAARLSSRGHQVFRIPMLPPTDLVRADDRQESWTGSFVSPTQSLLIQTADGLVALLPKRDLARFPATYASAAERCHQAQADTLSAMEVTTQFVNVDPVAQWGGLPSVATGSALWTPSVAAGGAGPL